MTTSPSPHPGKDPHDLIKQVLRTSSQKGTCPTHLVPKGDMSYAPRPKREHVLRTSSQKGTCPTHLVPKGNMSYAPRPKREHVLRLTHLVPKGDMSYAPRPKREHVLRTSSQKGTCPTHLVPKGVVGSLLCAGLLDLLPAHHLHDRVQPPTNQLPGLQEVHSDLQTENVR